MSTNAHTGDYIPLRTVGAGLMQTSYGPTWQALDLRLPENDDFREVLERIAAIEQRLAILRPNETLQAKYPSLQEAYDHYKLIEKIVNDQGTK